MVMVEIKRGLLRLLLVPFFDVFLFFFCQFPIKVVLLRSVNDERKTLEIKTRL